MKTFCVENPLKRSLIHVGERLTNVAAYLPDKRCVIITDDNVSRLYAHEFPRADVITIGTGEKIKTLATIESICRQLIDLGCDRQTFILGIGGGILCDIAGFAASVFMRGVSFGFVSTTLLSQVDASVGGKNGVNQDAYKNMIGVFAQPDFVICDISMLSTLPEAEISNGLGEIVKHGLISDKALFSFLEAHAAQALALDPDTTFRLVSDSVRIKSAVVQADEKEAGERRKLNFGHTLGHAMEKIRPDGHGRAVSMGMVAALKFSREKTGLPGEVINRTLDLLNRLDLPVTLDFRAEDIITAVSRDKKKENQQMFFVFLEAIGKAVVEKVKLTELNRFIHKIYQ